MAGAFKKVAKAKEPAKARKDEKPEFMDPKLSTAVEQWVRAKAAADQADQDKKEAEAEILPRAEEERVKASIAAGANQSTVIVNEKLAVSQSKRYTTVPAEAIADLQGIFGADADRFFKTRITAKVKESVMESDSLSDELAKAVGADNLEKFFDTTEVVEVSEAFHTERSTNPELAKKAKEAMEKGLLRPYKASVKLA